jgi:hypothetical protein
MLDPAHASQRDGSRLPDDVVALVVLVPVVAVTVFMAVREGAFDRSLWYPLALVFLLALVTARLAGVGGATRASRAWTVTVGAMSLYTAWTYLSIAWADTPAVAWDGANRTLLYLLVLATVGSVAIGVRAAWIALALLCLGVAALAVVTVVGFLQTEDVSGLPFGSRLSAPLGYPNATAAVFMVAFWLAVGLASRRWLAVPVRAAAFGAAGVLAPLSLLAASRGSLFTLPAVTITFVALVPHRVRSVTTALVVAVGIAPAVVPALDVYRSQSAAELRVAATAALWWTLAVAAGLALAGAVIAYADRRIEVPRRVRHAAGIGLVAAAVAGTVAVLAVVEPWQHAGAWWEDFRRNGEVTSETTRFAGLGTNRDDFWRVALNEFRAHPVGGIGADNFLTPYLEQRRSPESPIYPHSLAFGLLSQTGVVGTLLFLAAVGAAVWTVVRVVAGPARELASIALVGASVVLWHGLVDWLWEIPALGVLALGLVGVALGLSRTAVASPETGNGRRPAVARAWQAGVALLAVVVGASLALPWLAERSIDRAAAVWRADPDRAYHLLDGARRLNPLSNRADVIAGAIASRHGSYETMRVRFEQAVARDPRDWYAQFQLGVAASATGRPGQARAALLAALRMNPHEEIVATVTRQALAGEGLDPAAVERALLDSDPWAR